MSDVELTGLVVRAVRELAGEEILPLETRFSYSEPEDTSEHRRLLRSPLVFDRPNVALVFRESDLDRPVRAADHTLGGLLEGLRRKLATTLLKEPSLAVYEVSFLLGYSEPSTFHRAFRRWNGLSPHEFRRKAR